MEMNEFRNGFITGAIVATLTIGITLSIVNYRGSEMFDRLIENEINEANNKPK